MWDLPRPGLEPVSPALAGRFLTTAPPGKPHGNILSRRGTWSRSHQKSYGGVSKEGVLEEAIGEAWTIVRGLSK